MKLYRRGEIWWVTYGSRPQVRVSTHCTDKRQAEDFAMRYVAASMKEDAAELLERAAKARQDARSCRALSLRLEDAFSVEWYMKTCGVKRSSAGIVAGYWRRLVSFCASAGVRDVAGLTRAVCDRFLDTLTPDGARRASTFCRKILSLRGCGDAPFRSVRRPTPDRHREPLTPEQVKMLFSYLDAEAERRTGRHRATAKEFASLVRVMLYTGLRVGDAATLTADMTDVSSGSIRRRMAKTGRMVEFPAHPAIQGILAEAASSSEGTSGYLFPSMAASYIRRGHGTISHRLKAALRAIGADGESGQYCAHCLRTTFATLCAEHGVPLAVIQSWLGHTSPMVTRIYARIEDLKRKREALERLPDFG